MSSRNANTEIYDRIVDRASLIRKYEEGLAGKVDIILDGHRVRVDDLIRKAKLSGRGLIKFRDAVDKELSNTYSEAYKTTRHSLFSFASDQLAFTYQNLEATVGDIWRTQRPTRRVSEDIVLKRPLLDDMTLESGWAGISRGERWRIEKVIRKGISDGLSEAEIAKLVRESSLHKISRNQSRGLVTTAVTSVHAQADHEVYVANEKALRGWQYIAVLDSKTTPICIHRNGEIYLIGQVEYLPPAHYRCRSSTIPVVKAWSDLASLEGVAYVRKRNLKGLSQKEIEFYDGMTPLVETYSQWLMRQSPEVQLRHLGSETKVSLFRSGAISPDKFINNKGESIGLSELRRMSAVAPSGDSVRFAAAKEKLDSLHIGASTPDDFLSDDTLHKKLIDYYLLQSKELDGTLSLTNYRGVLIGNKRANKNRVLSSPPREDQMVFNPITGRYEDTRMYRPAPQVLANSLRLVNESDVLKPADIKFITSVSDALSEKMSVNELAVVIENLRILFTRYRKNPEPWANFKAVVQAQIKFDIMNVSDAIETQVRKDADPLKKLLADNYIDPVLGSVQLDTLSREFIPNIKARNHWEDIVAPKIAKKIKPIFNTAIPIKISMRLSKDELDQFYLRLVHRLASADMPDIDQLAVDIGRDLYNSANFNGSRNEWHTLGMKILHSKGTEKLYELETFGVQKRRMRSRMSGSYFGPYYDTMSWNIRITDPRLRQYSQLTRKIELGLRVSVTDDKNRLFIKRGYKTYFAKNGVFGDYDTRIPITSTSSFHDFPEELVDDDLANALNWAAQAKYKIDEDFYDFIHKLLYFEDDRGNARKYNELNSYRRHIASRSDSYERFKAMEWLRKNRAAFSNHPFVDHRARIYERGLIGPQAGETFRPFLNTEVETNFSPEVFYNLQDQIGSFLGGTGDYFEGSYNSLSITGRQKIAEKWRPALVELGNHMLRKKPSDLRAILESEIVAQVDGEELGKLFRFAIEMAKIDNYLRGKYLNGGWLEIGVAPIDEGLKQRAIEALGIGREYKAITLNGKQVGAISYSGVGQDVKIDAIYSDVPRSGIAEAAIAQVVGEKSSFAFVEPDNKASMGLFSKLGYVLESQRKIDGVAYNVMYKAPSRVYESLDRLNSYKTALALEQDASSSGAQIIALTTRNKQLAELSNVVPTDYKKRLYDEIARATFNDPRFIKLNEHLGLTEKDLRKASKAQNMVTFYGAGQRTGILNVEGKLAKVLGKDSDTLVIRAAERDTILNEISARIARYEKFDPETAEELADLRKNVKDVFDKGLDPGDDILEQLYFLDPANRELVERMTRNYNKVVTPADFKQIAGIMSEHLAEQVPILKDFTRYFGRLAEDFLKSAKPSESAFDWKTIAKIRLFGSRSKGYVLPDEISKLLGVKPGTPVSEEFLKRYSFFPKNSNLDQFLRGVPPAKSRRTGAKYFKLKLFKLKTISELEVLYANKLPKKWTNVPWVNFDGKTVEQNFTQVFEARLNYKDKDGNWVTNILQIPQKTDATWWEQIINDAGNIYDIADATKARTAYPVNGNHSNDAVIVKRLHLWGRKNKVPTSTVHDAFVTNINDMLEAREALRKIYAETLKDNVILATLLEMRKRGLPKELYDKYLDEAIEKGLIPIIGKSKINGRLMQPSDILTEEDILKPIPHGFSEDYSWYGVG